MTGIDDLTVTGFQIIFFHRAVNLDQHGSGAFKFLHDKAFAAEQSCAKLFLEENRHLYAFITAKETMLLRNDPIARCQFKSTDIAGEAGGKTDLSIFDRRIAIPEHALAGKSTTEHFPDTAALCLHLNLIIHPGHTALFTPDRLSGFHVNQCCRQRSTKNFVIHKCLLSRSFLLSFLTTFIISHSMYLYKKASLKVMILSEKLFNILILLCLLMFLQSRSQALPAVQDLRRSAPHTSDLMRPLLSGMR